MGTVEQRYENQETDIKIPKENNWNFKLLKEIRPMNESIRQIRVTGTIDTLQITMNF